MSGRAETPEGQVAVVVFRPRVSIHNDQAQFQGGSVADTL